MPIPVILLFRRSTPLSLNIYIEAKSLQDPTAEATEFPCIQTPTETTFKILKADSPVDAYREWVKSLPWDTEEHISGLDAFLTYHSPPDYEIKVSMI
jgi:hypothetical protein